MLKAIEFKTKQLQKSIQGEVQYLGLEDAEVIRKASADKKCFTVGIRAFIDGDNYEATCTIKVSRSGKAMSIYMVTDAEGPQLVYRGKPSVTAYSIFSEAILQECVTYFMEVVA